MRLHIDTSATLYMATGAPTPVLDRETRTQRVDDQGRPLYTVSLLAISPDGPEIHDVKFAGETKGLEEMTPVKVTKLVASPWSIGDRNGISFRADQVQPLTKAAA